MRTVRQWARETTGGLPRQFWYLWGGSLVNRLGSFVVIFLAIYLHQARHFSTAFTGLVLGLFGIGGAIGTTIGGMLTDHWGRRRTLLLGHVCGAAMMIFLGLASSRWAIVAGALALGITGEMARPAFSAMMTDIVPTRDRLRAFTLNYWAVNLGFACAATLAGIAAHASYLLLFVIDASTTLATAAIIFWKVRETRPAAHPAAAAATGGKDGGARTVRERGALHAIVRDPVFLTYVGLNLLISLVFMQHISMLPIAMGDDGLTPATFGSVIALNGILIVSGQLFIPRLIRGRGRSHVLALAALIIGAGFGLTAFAHTALFYAVTVLIWTVGEMLNTPSNSTLIAELSPAHMRGRYQGTFSLSWSVAAFVAPVLGGYVREHLGNATLWLGCAVITVVVAGAQILAGPARERRVAHLRDAAAPLAVPAVSAAGVAPVVAPTPVAPTPVAPVVAAPVVAEPALAGATTG